jgi:hypothetical protein
VALLGQHHLGQHHHEKPAGRRLHPADGDPLRDEVDAVTGQVRDALAGVLVNPQHGEAPWMTGDFKVGGAMNSQPLRRRSRHCLTPQSRPRGAQAPYA